MPEVATLFGNFVERIRNKRLCEAKVIIRDIIMDLCGRGKMHFVYHGDYIFVCYFQGQVIVIRKVRLGEMSLMDKCIFSVSSDRLEVLVSDINDHYCDPAKAPPIIQLWRYISERYDGSIPHATSEREIIEKGALVS